MASATKTFDANIIASITSGIMMYDSEGGFGKIHQAIEWLAGHPVWTHELPDMCRKVCGDLLKAYPALPARDSFDTAKWREKADEVAAAYPNGLTLGQGNYERTADPLETLSAMVSDPSKIAAVEIET